MAKIKRYDNYGTPIYDVSELEEYVYGGRKKLYKIPGGGICDRSGEPLGMLDLISLGISLEPEKEEPALGLSDSEIEAQMTETTDEHKLKILQFRKLCNSSFRGDADSIIDPMFGELNYSGKRWAEDIGEEMVRQCHDEQKAYFDRFPSEEEVEEFLRDLFGADYCFHADKHGDNYFVRMIDEDTNECYKFMICNKNIYTMTNEDEEEQKTELEDILRAETDCILQKIYKEEEKG